LRYADGSVKKFKKGVGIVAQETDAVFIPAYIDGAFKAWSRTRAFPRLCKISVRFGEACGFKQLLAEGKKLGIDDNAEAIATAVKERVVRLV